MINLSRKLLLLTPLAAVIIFFFLFGIPAGFAAGEPAPNQTGTATTQAKPTRTPLPTFTATLPPAVPTKIGTSRPSAVEPQGTPFSALEQPLPTAVPYLGTSTPIPDVSSFPNKATFSFLDAGVSSFTLHYPDFYSFDIDLPDRWQISPSASFLEIRYTLAENYTDRVSTRLPYDYRYRFGFDRPMLEVYVDDNLAGAIPLEVGDHTAQVKLPFVLVESMRWNANNGHTITFEYYRGSDFLCDYSGVITIHDVSTINLTFNVLPATLNLSTFPQPLIQNSFIPETLLLVVPDDANEQDLAIVAKLSIAIGRLTIYSNVKLSVLRSSEVSPALLSKYSAIFIGTPRRNAYLASLFKADKFVTKIASDGLTIMGVGADEGLLQLAHSDINPNNTFLAVTGNSDRGVEKAANDLAYPPVGLSGLFFISRTEFTPQTTPTPVPEVRRLVDLRYTERLFYGIGRQYQSFSFFVPRNWDVQDGVKLVLVYSHSTNLSYNNSGVSVYLNDRPIGSVPLDMNDFGEVQFTIPIKKENIIPGAVNRVMFEVTLVRPLDCAQYEAYTVWFNVRDSSLLYLPYRIITDPNALPEMHDPLFYIVSDPKFMIVLPEKPNKLEMSGMASFLRILGTQLNYPYFDIKVSMDPKLDPKAYPDYNFVGIGRPTRNPFIQAVNDGLPQPFLPGQDTLTLQQKIGDYRIEQSIGVGMVQALAAPWNNLRGITVLTGTSEDGLKWTLDRISDLNHLNEFTGELTFVEMDKVRSFMLGVPLHMNVASIVSELTGKPASLEPVVTQIASQGNAPGPVAGDQYLTPKSAAAPNIGIYAIVGLVAIGLIIAVISISRTIRGGRKR